MKINFNGDKEKRIAAYKDEDLLLNSECLKKGGQVKNDSSKTYSERKRKNRSLKTAVKNEPVSHAFHFLNVDSFILIRSLISNHVIYILPVYIRGLI